MSVTQLVNSSFKTSSVIKKDAIERWIRVSFQIGGQIPRSLLVMNIQRCGSLDALIRCMEDEALIEHQKHRASDVLSVHHQVMLSEIFIGSLYEITRLMIERSISPTEPKFDELAHRLRLIRVPLEKMQIAADNKLKAPLQMMQTENSNEEDQIYEYKKGDPARSHIMPTGLSYNGSIKWHVVDITEDRSYWIERRSLAETFLEIFD